MKFKLGHQFSATTSLLMLIAQMLFLYNTNVEQNIWMFVAWTAVTVSAAYLMVTHTIEAAKE